MESFPCDESEEETNTQSAKNCFRGVLADVVLCGHMEFLSFHSCFFPLILGRFFCLLHFFRSYSLVLIGLFSRICFEGLRGFKSAFLEFACLCAGCCGEITCCVAEF